MAKKCKRRLFTICAVLIVLGMMPSFASAETFAIDIPSDAWFVNEVTYVLNQGIMQLKRNGKFSPYDSMTRGDFCYAIHQIAGSPIVDEENWIIPFTDVDDAIEGNLYTAIRWANHEGIVNGYSDKTFRPNQAISRAQITAFLHRYAKYAGQDFTLGSDKGNEKFYDEYLISQVFIDDVYWARDNGYVSGFSDGTFRPNHAVTRAQSAAILSRYHQGIARFFKGVGQSSSSITPVGVGSLLASPSYPETAQFPSFDNSDGHRISYTEREQISALQAKWLRNASERFYSFTSEDAEPLHGFMAKVLQEYLSNSNGNRAFSPTNVYLTLAMLSEVTAGNTQDQILNLLGVDDVEEARDNAKRIWESNFRDDVVSTILGNSLWLNEDFNANGIYNDSTLSNLSKYYFASVYEGNPESDEYVQIFHDWLNAQTGELLQNEANEQKLGKGLTIASTLFFKAQWNSKFSKDETKRSIFHGQGKDIVCDFMYQDEKCSYYWGNNFTAVYQDLASNGGMWFLLPNKGIDPEELLNDTEALSLIFSDGYGWEKSKDYVIVHKSIPKFDFTSHFGSDEFLGGLKDLGVTDVFNEDLADFSNLGTFDSAYVDGGEHAVRTSIDEEGCTAVAFTVIRIFGAMGSGIQPEEFDFVLDRPFLYCVTGAGDLPLFTGIVYEPTVVS